MTPRSRSALLVAAVILLALNLRLVFGSVSPVLADIARSYHLSSVLSAALTTGPVLCLGLLAPLAPRLAARWGNRLVLLVCLVAIALGAGLRAVPAPPPLFAGALLAGAAIAVANVLLPGLVKREFPHRIGVMTGLATMLMSAGPGIASAATAPMQHLFGGSWQAALGAWAVPAVVAALLWVAVVWRCGTGKVEVTTGSAHLPLTAVLREPTAWKITVFMGVQSLLAYSMIGWLPTIYRDHGFSAGAAGNLLAILSVASIPTALAVPVLAARARSQHWPALIVVGFSVLGLAGVLFAPTAAAPVWAILLGLGQGGQLGLALTLMSLRAKDHAHAAAISGMAQSVGYVLASAGPLLLGLTHTASGSWTLPVALLLALMAPLAFAGYQAGLRR
ncbi:MFS transporter [Amycolatopsis acidicola]|uniref:MFS transporter n=1 Tax=Amycolatopsis acidicola TaxID=2596893 RepID=A0A5N0UHU0_9PSEU|nr:MFS transporter [Amycolatopsis acidicola]KAA9148128.1 MFS transporter [Amycolatopsis acidicola]